MLAGRAGLRILDVGCGAGVLTHHLSPYGSALGIDFSGPAIELARRLAPEASFRVASLEDLGDECFDLITVFDVTRDRRGPPADTARTPKAES